MLSGRIEELGLGSFYRKGGDRGSNKQDKRVTPAALVKGIVTIVVMG
jgi:hypothetical protein